MAKTKLLTFLQESLLPPVLSATLSSIEMSSLTLYFVWIICLEHYFKILLLLLFFYPISFVLFSFFSIFHSTQPLSIQHTHAETIVFPIILITSPCLNFTGSPSCFYIPNSNSCPCMQSPLGRNPRIIPLPCSYNYMKHLSNLLQ